jgi:hypothetical protein
MVNVREPTELQGVRDATSCGCERTALTVSRFEALGRFILARRRGRLAEGTPGSCGTYRIRAVAAGRVATGPLGFCTSVAAAPFMLRCSAGAELRYHSGCRGMRGQF